MGGFGLGDGLARLPQLTGADQAVDRLDLGRRPAARKPGQIGGRLPLRILQLQAPQLGLGGGGVALLDVEVQRQKLIRRGGGLRPGLACKDHEGQGEERGTDHIGTHRAKAVAWATRAIRCRVAG